MTEQTTQPQRRLKDDALALLKTWWHLFEPIQLKWVWLTNIIIYAGLAYGVWHAVKYGTTGNANPVINLLVLGKHRVLVWGGASAPSGMWTWGCVIGLLVFVVCVIAMKYLERARTSSHCIIAALAWGGWILLVHTLGFAKVAWPWFQIVAQ